MFLKICRSDGKGKNMLILVTNEAGYIGKIKTELPKRNLNKDTAAENHESRQDDGF